MGSEMCIRDRHGRYPAQTIARDNNLRHESTKMKDPRRRKLLPFLGLIVPPIIASGGILWARGLRGDSAGIIQQRLIIIAVFLSWFALCTGLAVWQKRIRQSAG